MKKSTVIKRCAAVLIFLHIFPFIGYLFDRTNSKPLIDATVPEGVSPEIIGLINGYVFSGCAILLIGFVLLLGWLVFSD